MTLLATLMLVLAVEPKLSVTPNAQPPSAAARVAVTAAAGLGTAVALVGVSAGISLLIPCTSWNCLYTLMGGLAVGGIATLVAVPLVEVLVAQAMGARGAEWTGVAGWVVGLLVSGAIGYGTAVLSVGGGGPTVAVEGAVLAGLALFLAPAIALEISHAASIDVTPIVAPVAGGGVVGVACAF